MFDNLFTTSPGVWSALIAGMIALPLLIHLINLLRHKRVKWAAMEFLLKSDRKHRNWVWLKQLLLLLSRIGLLLMVLLMLAQVGCQENRIAKLLGGATTHHYIVLDDSFSMSARNSQDSAFDRARKTLSLINARAKNRQNQLISIFRTSTFRHQDESSSDAIEADDTTATDAIKFVADLNGVLVDNRFDERMAAVNSQLMVSNLSIGLDNALEAVAALIKERKNENAIVYVLSDFRQREWENPQDTESILNDIEESGAGIELIRCDTSPSDNLAISALQPSGNVRVEGVPMMMQVTVKNYGKQNAEKIQVKLNSIVAQANTTDDSLKVEELPTVFIPEIKAGETATRQFPVYFATQGKHVVFADLPPDTVAVDNRRWCAVDIKSSAKVLIIDSTQEHSGFLALALNPNRLTGIQAAVQSEDFLRDMENSRLEEFDVIFLLDVDALDDTACKKLEAYVSNGGGLGIFLGPKTNRNLYNRNLYNDGEGLLPMNLDQVVDLPERLEDTPSDIAAEAHPIFAPVLGVKNSLLDLVQIEKFIAPGIDAANVENTSRVLATVRGISGWPLIVEKKFGDGRVVLCTTTAGPIWNNWSRNATFPPILLLLQDYLAQGRYRENTNIVGSPIRLKLPKESYLPTVSLRQLLGDQLVSGEELTSEWKLATSTLEPEQLSGSIGYFQPSAMSGETDQPGVFDVILTSTDSQMQVRRLAVNVDSSEGDLRLVQPQQLLAKLGKIQPSLVTWNEFNPEPKQKPVSPIGRLLLILAVGLLVVEQILAYSSSYHQ